MVSAAAHGSSSWKSGEIGNRQIMYFIYKGATSCVSYTNKAAHLSCWLWNDLQFP